MTAGWSPGAVVLARITGAAVAPAAVRAVEPARAVGSDPPRAAPGRALRHARRRRRPARLLPGRLPDGRRHRPAHRVPRHRPRRAVGVGADPRSARTGSPASASCWPWSGSPSSSTSPARRPRPRRRAVGPARGRRAWPATTCSPARPTAIPSTAFAGLGLTVGAVVARASPVSSGSCRWRSATPTVEVAGAGIPAWLALAELVVVAAAFAYVLGILGARLLGLDPGVVRRPHRGALRGALRLAAARRAAGAAAARRRRACCSRGSWPCGSASATWRRAARRRGRRRSEPISTFPRPSPRLGGLPRRGTSHRPELSGLTAHERSTHP